MTKGKADGFNPATDLGITVGKPAGTDFSDQHYLAMKRFTDIYLKALGPIGSPASEAMKSTEVLRSQAMAATMRMTGFPAQMFDQMMGQVGLVAREPSGNHYPDMHSFTRKNRLISHNLDGTLNRVFSADVRSMFQPGKEKDWPHLILTSNHALCTDHTHISGIMRGFRKLVMDTFDKPVHLIRNPHDASERNERRNDASRHTLMLSAVDAEPNAWLNGAELIDRLVHLRREYDASSGRKAPETEAHISPAAIRLAKFMLRLMVEEGSLNRIDPFSNRLTFQDETERNGYHAVRNPLEGSHGEDVLFDKSGKQVEFQPIVLRADAPLIAQHLKLVGYSKGGNTVTDALRYLLKELRQTLPDGTAVFNIRDARQEDKTRPMRQPQIADIMRNIGLLNVATGEVPLSYEEKQYGIRRLSILNEHDLIANHFRHGYTHHYGTHDDLMVIKGSKDHLGHGPKEALGFYEDEGENSKGALMADPQVRNRLRCFFASMFDKLAIADLVIVPAYNHHGPEIEIELSPGAAVNDVDIRRYMDTVVTAISDGLRTVPGKFSLYTDPDNRSLRIRQWHGEPFENEDLTRVVLALDKVFKDLQENKIGVDPKLLADPDAEKVNNIVISNNIFNSIQNYLTHGRQVEPGDDRPASYAARVLQDRPHDEGRIYAREGSNAVQRAVGSGAAATGRV